MRKMFKPSMFNYILEDETGLILYNSYVGTKSIVTVSDEKKSAVKQLLSASEIDQDLLGEEGKALLEHGLLVPSEENEKIKRDFLFSQFVNDDSLDLVITVTEKCNFVCKYCAQEFAKGKMSEEVQDNIIEYVKKNISRYNGVHVEWFGGEPLLCVDVIERLSSSFIDICRKAHKAYTASITTNGYLLDFDTFKKLYNCKVISYQITLDGLKQQHDKQRCLANSAGTYDRILSNLIAIKEKTKSAFFRINIRTNFTKDIVDNMGEYLRFYEAQFLGDVRFSFFARAVGDWGGDRVKTFTGLLDEKEEDSLFDRIYENNPQIPFHMNYSFLEPGRSVCHAVKKNMFNIGCDGRIYKCDSSIDIAYIGDLVDGGEMIIDEYKVALWGCGTRYSAQECDDCFFSCSCIKGGCPLDIIRGCSSTYSRCPFEKGNIESLLKMFVKNETTDRI